MSASVSFADVTQEWAWHCRLHHIPRLPLGRPLVLHTGMGGAAIYKQPFGSHRGIRGNAEAL